MLLAFHKPYGVLSQFTPDGSPNRTLAEFNFPKNVYAIGRLDADSEGLLFFTDEPGLNTRLLHPRNAHEREYWAHVERIPTPEALAQLGKGLVIQGHKTLPSRAWLLEPQPIVSLVADDVRSLTSTGEKLETPHVVTYPTIPSPRAQVSLSPSDGERAGVRGVPRISPRVPPIRFRKSVPDCWIGLELIEGKNRQVRRMTAAIGHPTLRLLRVRIGQFTLGDLPPGQWCELGEAERRAVLA